MENEEIIDLIHKQMIANIKNSEFWEDIRNWSLFNPGRGYKSYYKAIELPPREPSDRRYVPRSRSRICAPSAWFARA